MLLKWIGWLLGYVTVSVQGDSPTRFMNLCAFKRRDVWDFCATPDGMTANVRVSEYKKLRATARTAGCRLHILERHGLPFWIRRYRTRYGLLCGLILFVLVVNGLCGRIWQIDVQGNTGLSDREILQMLAEFDIKEGTSSTAYEWATVRQEILKTHPEISWMSFNPVGTVLHVDISEATAAPMAPEDSEPCHVKAARDGRIVEMQVYTGDAAVRVGDAVVKGDLLVNGAVTYADGFTVLKHAKAVILAETKHTVSFSVPLRRTVQKRTGHKTQRRVLRVFGLDIPLYIGSVSGEYEKETRENAVVIGGVTLPLSLVNATFYEVENETMALQQDEAAAEGAEQVDEYIAEHLSQAQIKDVSYRRKVQNNVLTLTAEISCVEDISFCENMLIF